MIDNNNNFAARLLIDSEFMIVRGIAFIFDEFESAPIAQISLSVDTQRNGPIFLLFFDSNKSHFQGGKFGGIPFFFRLLLVPMILHMEQIILFLDVRQSTECRFIFVDVALADYFSFFFRNIFVVVAAR